MGYQMQSHLFPIPKFYSRICLAVDLACHFYRGGGYLLRIRLGKHTLAIRCPFTLAS